MIINLFKIKHFYYNKMIMMINKVLNKNNNKRKIQIKIILKVLKIMNKKTLIENQNNYQKMMKISYYLIL